MTKTYEFIRAGTTGETVVDGHSGITPDLYFSTAKIESGQSRSFSTEDREICVVVMVGTVDIEAGAKRFEAVGGRTDIFESMPDSVYCGSGYGEVVVTARDGAEIAVAGGPSKAGFPSFRVFPEEVEAVEVGSLETHSLRRLHHILGKNQDGRVDRLIVSERFTSPGCWAGYPPHKHGSARADESAHLEVYHYRFKPENGFGAQYWYDDNGNSEVFMTRHGDTFVFADGYHPTVQSPGHTEYCFTILLGRDQRSLVQHFRGTIPLHDERFSWH